MTLELTTDRALTPAICEKVEGARMNVQQSWEYLERLGRELQERDDRERLARLREYQGLLRRVHDGLVEMFS